MPLYEKIDKHTKRFKRGIRLEQFPVNTANARTIHKLQGRSLEAVLIHSWDYTGNWIYVALSDLELPARLNCLTDDLAAEAHEQQHLNDARDPMIEGVQCRVIVDGTAISSHLSSSLRGLRSTRKLRTKVREQMGVSTQVFEEIDWGAHEQAGANCQDVPNGFLAKFLHRLLPVGTRLVKYDAVRYSSKCPSCGEEEEDQDHLLRCQNPERARWQGSVKKEIHSYFTRTDTYEGIRDVLIQGLHAWFNEACFPIHRFRGELKNLARSQGRIGWGQVFYGRMSTQWNTVQVASLHRRQIPVNHRNSGQVWLSNLIRLIWKQCHAEWKVRNEARHGHDEETRKAAKLADLKITLTFLYRLRDDVLPADRNKFFYTNVDEHVEREPTVKNQQDWVTTY
jgi:hypothetical protein